MLNEKFDRAIDAMLAWGEFARLAAGDPAIAPMMQVAAELRGLPRENFKTILKADLIRRGTMSSNPAVSKTEATGAAARVTATPRLAFRNPARAIELYQRALGAKERFRFQVGDEIPHAEIMIGDSAIDVTGEWPEGGRFSAETLGYSPISMSIQVADVDAFAEHAVAEGMKLLREPKDQFYGHRDATLQDPFGYSWAVFTVKEEMSVEEMHRRMKGITEGPEGGKVPESGTGVNPVPRGFRMLTPYLVAADGLALLEFIKQGLGAEELMRVVMPTGVHAEVRIGDTTLMMGGGLPGKKFTGPLQLGALHTYVEDADAVTERAVAAGASLIDEPRDQEYGERSSTVKDPHGNLWYIATHHGESHIPEGLQSVNPYLYPRRAEPLISFLKRAFGAQEVAKYSSPDGVIQHAVVRVGDSVLEMGEAHGKYEPMPSMFYLYVLNMEAVYRQALAAGATKLHEPTDQPYGDRNAVVKDAFGNTWYIATHIKDVSF